jgi:putative nucleotidyltransferase with HDIG domain
MDRETGMEQRVYIHKPAGMRRAAPEPRPANYRVRLLSAVNSMPPLPEALNRLLGMLNSESVSAARIAAVIEGDSVLSGNVMRCVNSPYYGVPRRISSIRHAVALLGFQTVRNLALAFSMRRMMTGSAASRRLYSSYSRHALATALLTQAAAAETSVCEMETAFAAGLFHDVGKLLIYTAAPEAVPAIVEIWEAGEGTYEEAEQEVIETTHPELSAIVLEGWKLPEEIRNAARYHHAPEDCPAEGEAIAPALARLVQAADLMVNLEGFRSPGSAKAIDADPAEALLGLGLGGDAGALMERVRGELENLQEMFQ